MKLSVLLLFCNSLITTIYAGAVPKIADPYAEEAQPGKFAFSVSIQIDCRSVCGGSLISEKHVLTAAHCVADYVKTLNSSNSDTQCRKRMTVEVGSTRIGWGTTHDIRRISHKDNYDSRDDTHYIYPNDVAVITLVHPIEENGLAKPIDIYEGELPIHQKLMISGFGNIRVGLPGSPVLKVDTVKRVSSKGCAALWSGKIILEYQICAMDPGHGVCQGDSGGPLTLEMQGKQYLVGIISSGAGICGGGLPDIYTKAAHFMGYINDEKSYDFTSQGVPGAIGVNLHVSDAGLPKPGNLKCTPNCVIVQAPELGSDPPPQIFQPPKHVLLPLPDGYPFPSSGHYPPALPIVHPHPLPINFLTAPLGGPHFSPSGQLLHPSPGLHPVFPTNEFSPNNVYQQAQPAGFLQLAPAHQLQPTWQAG